MGDCRPRKNSTIVEVAVGSGGGGGVVAAVVVVVGETRNCVLIVAVAELMSHSVVLSLSFHGLFGIASMEYVCIEMDEGMHNQCHDEW